MDKIVTLAKHVLHAGEMQGGILQRRQTKASSAFSQRPGTSMRNRFPEVIGLPVTNVAVHLSRWTRAVQADSAEPIGDASPDILRTFDVAVDNYAIGPAGKLLLVRPAFKFYLLGKAG